MPTTSYNSEADLPFRGTGCFTGPVARGLGSLLLLVIALFLSPVVCAQSQTGITAAELSGIFGMAETAPVVISGRVDPHLSTRGARDQCQIDQGNELVSN